MVNWLIATADTIVGADRQAGAPASPAGRDCNPGKYRLQTSLALPPLPSGCRRGSASALAN